MSSTCSKSSEATKIGFFCAAAMARQSLGRVNLDNLPRQLVLLLQDEPGEVGGVFQIGDDDAFDVDAEALEDAIDEVVGERTFLGVSRRNMPMTAPICGSTLMTKTLSSLPTNNAQPLLAGRIPRICTGTTSCFIGTL